MLKKFKYGLVLCGIATLGYFLWPAVMWTLKVYIFNLFYEYGFYALFFLVGGGYLWWKFIR